MRAIYEEEEEEEDMALHHRASLREHDDYIETPDNEFLIKRTEDYLMSIYISGSDSSDTEEEEEEEQEVCTNATNINRLPQTSDVDCFSSRMIRHHNSRSWKRTGMRKFNTSIRGIAYSTDFAQSYTDPNTRQDTTVLYEVQTDVDVVIEYVILKKKEISIENEIRMIRYGTIPLVSRSFRIKKEKRVLMQTKLSLVIDTFQKEDCKSFENTDVLVSFAAYIHIVLRYRHGIQLSYIHSEYILDLCDKKMSNNFLIICMLPILYGKWTSRVKHEEFHTKFYNCLVRLTLYYHENPHVYWAPTLADTWSRLTKDENYREMFVDLFCEDLLFSEAFMDLMQYEIKYAFYIYKIGFPELEIYSRDYGQFCMGMMYDFLRYNKESARICTIANMYIPYIYGRRGKIRSRSVIVRHLIAEKEKMKSANKR
jgi:hypothetical protein